MKQTKRTLVSLLLVFAMLATCLVAFSLTGTAAGEADVWDGSTYTEPTKLDADGTTILVTSAAEFAWITKNPASAAGSYRLTTDLDMNAKTPSADNGTFAGTLDGDGHYVRNIKDSGGSGYGASGLFAGVSGTIRNLTIKDSIFSASGSKNVAPFATSGLSGTLENCHVVSCTIKGIAAAGLVFSCSGTIRNCTVYATISTTTLTNQQDHNIGGICGSVNSTAAVIENCTVNGTMSGTNYKTKSVIAGGLISYVVIGNDGWSWAGLKNCVNNATITVSDQLDGEALPTCTTGAVGGLVGKVYRGTANSNKGIASLTLNNCVNNGSITVTSDTTVTRGVGGIVGHTYNGIINAIDCVNNADVSASTVLGVGGFIGASTFTSGKNYGSGISVFQNCGQYGAITGADNVGGAIGYTYQDTTLENVVIAGSVTAKTGTTTGAVVAFQTEYTPANYTLSNHTLTMTNVYSPLTAALYNTDTAATGTLNATSSSVFAGTDFSTADLATYAGNLNTTASTNKWNEWKVVADSASPYLVFKGDAVQVAITGATLSLDDTMTLKLFVKSTAISDILGLDTLMVTDGTNNYTGKLKTIDSVNAYVFEISGLAAKDMGTAKTYTVKYTLTSDTANPITCDTGVTYSPLQYAVNMYKKNNGADKEFAALLTSMVRYMDAAGATGAMTTFATATGYTIDDTNVDTDYAKIVAEDAKSNFKVPENTMQLAADLESGITLIVKPAEGKTFTDVSVKIGDKVLAVETADGTWRVTGINPGDLYNELTFTITTSDGTVTATYSIARYLNSYVGTEYETLAKATALYMNAFITYKTLG